MHFSTDKRPYVREGFFREPAGDKRHYIEDMWYSVPTHGPGFVFELIEDPETKERRLKKQVLGPELNIEWIVRLDEERIQPRPSLR